MAEQHVSAGARIKIRHSTWNAIMDVVGQHKAAGLSGDSLTDSLTTGMVDIYNGTGTAFDANQVVGIDSPLFEESDNSGEFRLHPAFRAVKADGDHHEGTWLVCAEPIRDKAIGKAWVSGVAACQVEITDDAHTHAELTGSGSGTKLGSAASGRGRILTKTTGTAPYTAWCMVLLGSASDPSGIQWAKIQASPTLTNQKGDTQLEVHVKACDISGTETGDVFHVKTPLCPNKTTLLFTGNIVGYQPDVAGVNTIVTPCFDDHFGTVKAWIGTTGHRDLTGIPDGWEELTEARGRFLVGCETGETWDTPLDSAGIDLNNLTAGLQDHPEIDPAYDCLGIGMYGWRIHVPLGSTGNTRGPLDHRVTNETSNKSIAPPWLAVYWIQRTH